MRSWQQLTFVSLCSKWWYANVRKQLAVVSALVGAGGNLGAVTLGSRHSCNGLKYTVPFGLFLFLEGSFLSGSVQLRFGSVLFAVPSVSFFSVRGSAVLAGAGQRGAAWGWDRFCYTLLHSPATTYHLSPATTSLQPPSTSRLQSITLPRITRLSQDDPARNASSTNPVPRIAGFCFYKPIQDALLPFQAGSKF